MTARRRFEYCGKTDLTYLANLTLGRCLASHASDGGGSFSKAMLTSAFMPHNLAAVYSSEAEIQNLAKFVNFNSKLDTDTTSGNVAHRAIRAWSHADPRPFQDDISWCAVPRVFPLSR
jgi:hypothetical protein